MKYDGFFMWFFGGTMRKVIAKHYGKEYANEIMKKSKVVYRNIIEDAEDIGGMKNPLGYNYYFAFTFISPYIASNKEIKPEVIQEMMKEALYKVKFIFKVMNVNTKSGKKRFMMVINKYIKWYDQENQKKYPNSFDVTTDNSPNENACWYKISRCPICMTCDKLGVREIMPCLCELDNLMTKLSHGKLTREHTIAKDGDYCDYLVIGDKE